MPKFKFVGQFLYIVIAVAVLSACGSSNSNSGGGQDEPMALEPNLNAMVVGPNLNGDTWSGYLKNRTGGFKPMTAVIRQEGGIVIIDTSLENEVGEKLTGTISASGKMTVIDEFNNEDWTTLFGPASVDSINLADFVFIGGQRVDTNIIILKRL